MGVALGLPGFSAQNFHGLLADAFAIALLGLIEAVAIAASMISE